jgi:beta-glucanase (GH16 family)
MLAHSQKPSAKNFSAANRYAAEGYQLVWADEFNRNGSPDSMNWSYERGLVRNEEYQWYQPQNARCKNGLLVIEARREKKENPLYKAGGSDWRQKRAYNGYTSSSINTGRKQEWLYGRFEMHGRIDIRSGIWPAWWTLGVSKPWPANGEIDIMEYYRGRLLANIACKAASGAAEWHSNTFSVDSMGGSRWAQAFHVWRMDWDKDSIQLFIDNRLLNSTAVSALDNKDGSGFNPFRQAHYMLLNLAIGGQNGGDPTNTKFPARFEVDYVRVYQKVLSSKF